MRDIHRLSDVRLAGTSVDGPSLQALAATPGISTFVLVQSELPASGLSSLGQLESLTDLILCGDSVDATLLETLPQLPQLERFRLYGPALNLNDVIRLKSRLPRLERLLWYKPK